MTQLVTDWLRIATEGNTFQNVPIQRQWIVDIAETYNAKTYGARIWPDHRRWYGAWGDVVEVKAEEIDGKLCLFCKLTPNSQLILANEQDQKVYSSIELDPNFAGTGKAYLTGLGVTDEPASLGTDRLKFSVKDRLANHKYGAPEQLVMSYPLASTEDQTPTDKATEAASLFSKLVSLFSTQAPDPKQEAATDNPEEEPMDKKQFDALMGKFDTFGTKLTELETKVETFGKKPEADKKDDVKVELDADKNVDDKAATGITAEQFSKLETMFTGFSEKLGAMETKFNKLSAEVDGQEPNPTGTGESFSVV
ncbi:GPO family capsid scaffolding protein [Shewanella baltica]|uniref:GPO family capsid scaffolding protein n=1 Tax=Shewanella baltica TaxID=62322 RepID=UPI002871A7C6|nr:GPO family capsid scaffolding protein [Shewanella baltica]MDR9767679.1 GPO family capsid scaffolding protein [Shewanella baltica]